ncbi:hypothetical protein BDP27DRAFT_1364626 [Rhodocollybia butyracea]|uniref:Uncharacterized protein n=1 Tax=Rhodocollybia butyracea TaxID=206335 RepID=A0A9P5U7E8_9AGAR|nr:hypothetical protein BDP27DRAFT_1364626 [Rhodocollybia butyracea]
MQLDNLGDASPFVSMFTDGHALKSDPDCQPPSITLDDSDTGPTQTKSAKNGRKDAKNRAKRREEKCYALVDSEGIVAVSFGVSFGGGSKQPGNMCQTSQLAYDIMVALIALQCFARILGYANSLFMAFAFQSYTYCKSTLRQLFTWNPKLRHLMQLYYSNTPSSYCGD